MDLLLLGESTVDKDYISVVLLMPDHTAKRLISGSCRLLYIPLLTAQLWLPGPAQIPVSRISLVARLGLFGATLPRGPGTEYIHAD